MALGRLCDRVEPGVGRTGMEDETTRFVIVAVGGVLGALARYLVGTWASDRLGADFPYGTLIVNLTGCLLIGFGLTLLTERISAHPHWRLFLATGFLGAYTTFSAYAWESAQLLAGGEAARALVNLVGSVVLGMVGVGLGIVLARQL